VTAFRRAASTSTSRCLHRRPSLHSLKRQRTFLSQTLASLQGMTLTAPQPLLHHHRTVPTEVSTVRSWPLWRCSLPRFAPLQRFSNCGELHTSGEHPCSSGYVAPSGFCTLSTPCSHRGLPGLFHPDPAPGVSLRGFDPHTTPYVLSNADSLRVENTPGSATLERVSNLKRRPTVRD